ncbi:MAG TPA: GAF domain-containing protein [Acidimicrobiales bacterium]|nr:GAF domain-containing protein [Acidimicrobiales bacterium]
MQLLGRVSSGGADFVRQPVVLTFPPDLASVAGARAAVAELAKQWACSEDVTEDARVVISEFMSNGVLHARTQLEVVVGLLVDGALRIEVHDASSAPLLPPPEAEDFDATLLDEPRLDQREDDNPPAPPATGRGLLVVGALSTQWGWSLQPTGGKVVWAEVGDAAGQDPSKKAPNAGLPEPAMRTVRLIALPVRLLKASEDHFDDLFRELQMASLAVPPKDGQRRGVPATVSGATGGTGLPQAAAARLVPLAETVRSRFSPLRSPLRQAIWEAVHRGDRLVDVDLLVDAGLASTFALADQLVSESAQAASGGELLTEPPPAEVLAWRRWLRKEIYDQIAGRPPQACPFPVAPLPGGDGGPRSKTLGTARRRALTEVADVLAAAPLPYVAEVGGAPREEALSRGPGGTDDPVATRALQRTVGYLGATRAMICLLEDDNETIYFGASVGFSQPVTQYWSSFPLSADLPASECIRTGTALFFRTFAELDERYPIFLSTPAESDPCIACLPIAVNGQPPVMGCLTIGFGRARDFSSGDRSFLAQLVNELGSYIGEVRGQRAAAFAERRSLAVEEAQARVSAAATVEDALGEVVASIVPAIADAVWAHFLQDDGNFRGITSRHRDHTRDTVARQVLHEHELTARSASIVAECARTGQVRLLQHVSDAAMASAARGPRDLEMLKHLGVGSVGAVPVKAGDKVVAVVTVANDPGRFINEQEVEALKRLAAAAGDSISRLRT